LKAGARFNRLHTGRSFIQCLSCKDSVQGMTFALQSAKSR
jgi:hypothetical protein